MAGNIIIRFSGDASGLAQFYRSVGAQTDAFVKNIQKTYAADFTKTLGLQTTKSPLLDPRTGIQLRDAFGSKLFKTTGSDIKNIRVEMDALNNVLRVTGETGLRLANGELFSIGKTELIRGNVRELINANAELTKLLDKREQLSQRYGRGVHTSDGILGVGGISGQLAARRDAALAAAQPLRAALQSAQADLASWKSFRDEITQELHLRAQGIGPNGQQYNLAALQGNDAASIAFQRRTNELLNLRHALNNQVAVSTRAVARAQNEYNQALGHRDIAQYDARLERIRNRQAGILGGLRAQISAARANVGAALSTQNVDTPIGYQQLPKNLLSQLTRGGLASTGKDLYAQNATFNRPIQDLERGLIRFSGAYDQIIKVQGRSISVNREWTATVDQQGRVIQTTGRQLRGFTRVADQIVRDFQKVIEWTVATTLVFGGLAAAGQALEIIKDIDANLARLAVTAQFTQEETQNLYKELVKVANVTATPLEELVKAADDLALAVKRPGQTAQELTKEITTLGEAIGIYTNLTGEDTVEATDQLVAVMKQLGYTSTQVFGVLNKVTAAAGGQSGTISDITRALSVMAEAGKQANLTVDQQIGVIKTLSQVTSKSPAEIATAFKNLVGALENPAALKALKNYNIGLISEGNSIIDIYTQIAEKVRTGAIKDNDLSGLLRAISGGPRRAPDAAALLANINQVLAETEVSASATNDAFLANAQVMDTVQAKFNILQNILKDKVFTQFRDIFREVAEVALTAANTILPLFDIIPKGAITTVAQIGAMIVAIKLATNLFTGLGVSALGTFRGMLGSAAIFRLELGNILTNLKLIKAEMATGGIGAGIRGAGSFGGKFLKAGAIGALSGGALAAASGGGFNQIAGAGLQGLGIGLLTLPEPTLISKAAGGIALLAGTFLSLQQSTDETNNALERNAQAILTSYTAASEASRALKSTAENQETIAASIAQIEKESKNSPSPEQQAVLNDLYKQYASNVVQAADAHKQLNDAVEEFSTLQAEIPGAESYGARLRAALLSGEDTPEIKAIIREAQAQALRQIFPEIQGNLNNVTRFSFAPRVLPLGPGETIGRGEGQFSQTSNIAIATRRNTTPYGPRDFKENIDITELNAEKLKALFSEGTDGSIQFTAQMDLTQLAIDKINTAIAQLPEDIRSKYQSAFNIFKLGADPIDTAATAIAYFNLQAETLSAYGFDEAGAQVEGLAKAMQTLSTEGVANLDPAKLQEALQATSDLATRISETQEPATYEELSKIAGYVAEAQGPLDEVTSTTDGWNALLEEIVLKLFNIGPAFDPIVDGAAEAAAATQELRNAVKETRDDLLSDVAGKSADIFSQFLSGDIGADKYAKLAAELNQTGKSIREVSAAFNAAAKTGGQNFVSALDLVKKNLKDIPGLEDAASLSGDQLIERFFSLADTFNLTSGQIDKLGGRLSALFKALKKIAGTPYEIYLTADLSGLRQALIVARNAMANLQGHVGGPSGLSVAAKNVEAMEAAIRALRLTGGGGSRGGGSIGNIYRAGRGGGFGSSGSGGGGGGGSKTRQGKDVSELDLPEEIADSYRRSALIRQAIKNARRLQNEIPGARKEARNDIVELLKGTQRILEVRGVRDDLLRRALEELAEIEKKRLEFETKADTIRRIRVGAGDFAAIANVPVNSRTGVSFGGAEGPINVTLNLNGTVLSPAQFQQFADMIAASLKRQLAR